MLTETCARTGWTYHDVDSIVRAHVEGRTPSHDLVEAADAMRAHLMHDRNCSEGQPYVQDGEIGQAGCSCGLHEIESRYLAARARHAEGAQPSGAPYKSWIERGAEFEAATTPEKLSGAPAPVTYYVGDMSTLGDSKPNVAKVVEGSPARLISPSEGLELRERLAGAPATASYGGIPIVSNPSLRPGEIVAMSAGKEVGRIVDVPPASAQGEVMPGQDNDGVWIDTTPPSSEKTGEERK